MFDKGQSDLFLVKIDFEKCLINARTRYEEELNNNNYYNELIQTDATEENIKKVDALIDAIGEYYQGSDIISNNDSKQ